jgi:hypothetical protein
LLGVLILMRDYLYVWHDPEQRFLVASGIEFKDFLPCLKSQGGIVLIDHQSEIATYDASTSFDFVQASNLFELAAEDIYSWGNFVWADYAGPTFPSISDEEIAELLFLAHKAKPLHEASIPSLGNQFLGYEHDDGWYVQLYYTYWEQVERLLAAAIPATLGKLDVFELGRGVHGYWLQGGETHHEEKTHDVDKILNRWL